MLNVAVLMGRLTGDPEIRVTPDGKKVASFSVACDRDFKSRDGERQTDFLNIVAWEKTAEFLEKYFHKGTKLVVSGRIQTGSYTNKEGVKVYTTEVVVEDHEFAESRNASGNDGNSFNGGYSRGAASASGAGDGFMNIPDGIDEELPFN